MDSRLRGNDGENASAPAAVVAQLTGVWATARMRPPCPGGPDGGKPLPARLPQLHLVLLGEDMARKLSVSVDHNLCVGNQMCISIATKALTLNDDRQAIPADVDADTEEVIIEAAEQCPMAAISVMDADTGEQLFP